LHVDIPATLQDCALSKETKKTKATMNQNGDTLAAPEDSVPHVNGSAALHIVLFAQAPDAAHEPEFLMGLTMALNCCLTASSQPAQAVFKHANIVSIAWQDSAPVAEVTEER